MANELIIRTDQIIYPTDYKNNDTEYFYKFDSTKVQNEGIYYSNSPLFLNKRIDINRPFWYVKFNLEFTFIFADPSNNALDFNFNLNGIYYENSSTVYSRTKFIKTNDFNSLKNSMINMFKNYDFMEDYNLTFTSSTENNYKRITIKIVAKKVGYLYRLIFTPTFNNLVYEYNNYIYLTNNAYSILYPNYYYFSYKFGTNSIVTDNNNVGTGLVIYLNQVTEEYVNNYAYQKKIGELIKKESENVDFDINTICKNYISKWKPNINEFTLTICKHLEQFYVHELVTFADKRFDSENNYVQKYENDFSTISNTQNFYLLEGSTDELLDNNYTYVQKYEYIFYESYLSGTNYIVQNDKYNQKLSLDNLNAGTFGYNLNLELNNFQIYDKILSKVPRRKKINKSFELLYNILKLNSKLFQKINLYINFKFIKYNNTNLNIQINRESDQNDITERNGNPPYLWSNNAKIMEFCFNKNYLNSLLSPYSLDIDSDIREVEVNFFTYNYLDKYPINYEKITYYFDNTEDNCNDNTNITYDYTPICFKNSKGGFDIFDFETISELNSNRKIEYIDIPYTYLSKEDSDFKRIWNLEYNKSYKITSRILDNDEFIWLEDLVKSKEVYLLNLNDNKLYPIIVIDSDYGFKKNEDKTITIQFIYSKPEQI